MHESSIAIALVEQAVDAAGKHRAHQIDEVEVQVGVMRRIVPEALKLAFSAASAGTIAEDARLKIIEERIIAVCRVCDCLFAPESLTLVCPRCQRADARIVTGNDIILKSLTWRTEEEMVSS